MAKFYISEYEHLPILPQGSAPVGKEPSVATQLLDVGPVSQASAAFNVRAHFIRLHTDSICSFKFSKPDAVDAPVAVTSEGRMAANQTEYFGVDPGSRVAVIENE